MPMTTATEPGPRRSSDRRIARYGVTAASVNGAASDRVEVTERRQLAHAVDDHVRRHPAVDAEAPPGPGQLGDAIAEVLVAGLAVGARAAAQRAVDGDRLSDLEAGRARAERLDPSRPTRDRA